MVWSRFNNVTLEKQELARPGISVILIRPIYVMIWGEQAVLESERKAREKEERDPFGEEEDITLCVPNCRACPALRQTFTGDTSSFTFFILACVIVNILVGSLDSIYASERLVLAVYICNIIFLGIFGCEIIIKICVLGPVLYLSSTFNYLDMFLVTFGIVTIAGVPLPKSITNFRILRLLRLLRLYR